MSVTFSIPNKRKWFLYEPVLTVRKCLELYDGLIRFDFDPTDKNFSFNQFLYAKLSDKEPYPLLGIDGVSGRGMEVSYDSQRKAYGVRIEPPATVKDWEIAITFIKILAGKLGSEIIHEDGTVFTVGTIDDFDFRQDIKFGLRCLSEKSENDAPILIFGVTRPVAIDGKLGTQLLSADSPFEAFDELMKKTQYSDARPARLSFYKQEDSDALLGVYMLVEDTPTILPYKPFVEFGYQSIRNFDVAGWYVALMARKAAQDTKSYRSIGQLAFEDFIAKLPESKYEFLDALYIRVEALSKADLEMLRFAPW